MSIKRYIVKEWVLDTYKEYGIEGISKLYSYESFIFGDEFSSSILRLIEKDKMKKIASLIEKELKNVN